MASTHIQPDHAAEIQAIHADLLSPAILASSIAVPVPASMTLPAFATWGYVRNGSPVRLCYVNQDAATVTLAGGDGTYWLGLHADLSTPVSGWTRHSGTHYLWRAAGTQPADPPGGLVLAEVTVASGGITGANAAYNYPNTKVAYGGPGGALAFSSNLTWDGGTLKAVGTVDSKRFLVQNYVQDNAVAFHTDLTAGVNRWALFAGGTAPAYLNGALQVNGTVVLTNTLQVNGAVGLGGAPVAGFSLFTYGNASLAANVGIGLGAAPPAATLDVGGSLRVRASITGDGGATITGTITTNNLTTTNNVVAGTCLGAGGAADGRFSLRSYSTSYFDGYVGIQQVPSYALDVVGNMRLNGLLGVGTAPNGSWSVAAAGSILTLANFQANGTGYFGGVLTAGTGLTANGLLTANAGLTVNGTTYLNGTLGVVAAAQFSAPVGIQMTNDGSYGLACYYRMYCGADFYAATTITAGTRLVTNYLVASAETGLQMEPQSGWALSSNGAIWCGSGIANKVGGGPWGTTSSRTLKENIGPIPDALGLLLEQRGQQFEWTHPLHRAVLPGVQYGFILEDVTIPQWKDTTPDGTETLTTRGFEALCVESLRTIVARLEALERAA